MTPRTIGLILGPVLALLVGLSPTPEGLTVTGQWTGAITLWMAVWWLTEAVPVPATAMIPVAVLPPLGVIPAAQISAPYASKTIFLFLGGLIIATALERWNLHRRVALNVIGRFGGSASRLVLGFMTATAAASGWVSNSAVTMMTLPIATAVLAEVRRENESLATSLGPILLLAVAYSATIGGLATPVGTPPNAVLLGALAQLFPEAPPIGFLQWMLLGVPLVAVMIPAAWFYMVRFASNVHTFTDPLDARSIQEQLRELGPATVPERRLLAAFVTTALLWTFRRPLDLGAFELPGWSLLLPEPTMAGDSTVAMFMALALFVLPAGDGRGSRLLDWETAVKLPWGVILLLGGGFALAEAIRASGLAAWLGSGLGWMAVAPPLLAIAGLALFISFLTEVTTNTAITTIMMPILAASAVHGGRDPLLLMVPCTLAASLCFMMPSGTAPNAIVFSGGLLRVRYMAKVGFPLNLLAVILITIAVWTLGIWALGISLEGAPAWSLPS